MSRSVRRKTIKSAQLERSRLRRERIKNRWELESARLSFEDRLRVLRNDFAPHLAKLASVTIGVPWYRHVDDPPSFRSQAAEPVRFEEARIITTPTGRDVNVVVNLSSELLIYASSAGVATLIEEMARLVKVQTERGLSKILKGQAIR